MKIVAVMTTLGERSTEYAAYLTKKQVDELHIISNITPLKQASIACLEKALNSNADYFLMNDADVFIKKNTVDFLVSKLQKTKAPMATGFCMSRFFGRREGSAKLFDCKRLPEMIHHLKHNESPRPIASIHLKFKGLLVKDVLCLHEYEQYYKDIYRRFIVQSQRSKKQRHIDLIKKFKNSNNQELRVAYAGYFDKKKDFNSIFPNIKERGALTIEEGIKLYGK